MRGTGLPAGGRNRGQGGGTAGRGGGPVGGADCGRAYEGTRRLAVGRLMPGAGRRKGGRVTGGGRLPGWQAGEERGSSGRQTSKRGEELAG